ncbi:NAD(P)/FAD-dependent oxidoreductase [Anaerotignum sp. MSJ-24]|uniref:NAD(P)/FAD-dependent oxidoreductase n=1 Tax=Anaerotignum sp. MSJ-24 TaxID=2841521 RepID=UPI001C108A21|nr:NAD(P)/FAD-dependent oxidoreductase [Anaerotignum sp. MSJ-24]MBU5464571.1 NAD(P)/FAD-dependent oxidoreductase [Anaerotignum sp. MSJ-24]
MKVAVIGAGAAGMLAAGHAGELGHSVDIFEKNNIVGKKIRITGKGRCNITNASDCEEHIENTPGNPYFMYSALYKFPPDRMIELVESLGVPTKVERGKRVFPVSDKAADVSEALKKYMKKNGVKLHLEKGVNDIITENNKIKGIVTDDGKELDFDAVIVATGGLSYPTTGSTGDGYKFAKKAGHSVSKLMPSLVPLKSDDWICPELMGLSLKNSAIVIKNEKGKTIYKDFGEMLFTHFGVSGPMVLSASRHLLGRFNENITMYIDMKPALDMKALDNRLLRDFEKYINKDLRNALNDILPQKMIPVIIRLSGIDETKKIHDITKEERKRMEELIKGLPVHITGTAGFDMAVVTSGGVNTDEIDPSTMESRKIKGLFFAGEVIDVDAYTGGFNLQIAFSTGYTAAEGLEESK